MRINFDALPVGTQVFEQFPGVRFPGTPRIVKPSMAPASGSQALSNARPAEEFNAYPLAIEFAAPQTSVRLNAGLDQPSAAPVQASLRAFDAGGTLVAEDGPVALGPGPTEIRTVLAVAAPTPAIVRAELEYSGAYAEVIDDLDFDSVGADVPPDTVAPSVTIEQPTAGAKLTGERFLLKANITEDRKLRSLRVSISNARGQQDFAASFFGAAPTYRIGPVWSGTLAEGNNIVRLRAEDFAGNVGTAEVSVTRVPVAGSLVLPQQPVAIPRLPGSVVVPVALEETFPGSLAGRDDILIRVTAPEDMRGSGILRDPLNQPDPRLDLVVRAGPQTPFGRTDVLVEASDLESGRLIASGAFSASVIPNTQVACDDERILYYYAVSLDELTQEINGRMNALLAEDASITPRSDMVVSYDNGYIVVSQDYYIEFSGITVGFWMTAHLRPVLQPGRIEFAYSYYASSPDPGGIPFISDLIENRFDEAFQEPFRIGLGDGIMQRIDAVNPSLRFVLADVFVNPSEFGIGFCLPVSEWDQVPNTGYSRLIPIDWPLRTPRRAGSGAAPRRPVPVTT